MALATFGAGCFWGVEAAFRRTPGVLDVQVGYSGGSHQNPTYEEVCSNRTGHAEVARVRYDPEVAGYEDLLSVFWSIHDPTQLNRQGPDVGTQYRSVVFCHSAEQMKAALAYRDRLSTSGRFTRPIVTQIEMAGPFYRAEEYHQRYLEKLSHEAIGI